MESIHLSEYLPWFRKRKKEIKRWICKDSWIHGVTGGYLHACQAGADYFEKNYQKFLDGKSRAIELGMRSGETHSLHR